MFFSVTYRKRTLFYREAAILGLSHRAFHGWDKLLFTGLEKHTGLLCYGINYGRNWFYEIGSGGLDHRPF
jgi:hypothetical protein